MMFLMVNCENRRNTFCLTTVGYHISLYNLLDVDGRVEYSKRADSISWVVGSAEIQGVDGKHVIIIITIKLHAIPTCT